MLRLPLTRVSGRALRTLVSIVHTAPGRKLAAHLYRHELGIDAARALDDSARRVLPRTSFPLRAREEHGRVSEQLAIPRVLPQARSARSFEEAYRERRLSPEQVAQRLFAHARELASRTPSLGPFVVFDEARAMRAAAESSERWMRGQPLGPLDGVPIPIKEEVDVEGLPARFGTGFLPMDPAAADCVAVARLRASGALIVGQTPMTEYGLWPLGANVHRQMPKNPLDPTRLAGGSSTGSGVAVSTGISPVALALDGGGSIRVPACYTGVFGIKPTFGRIPVGGESGTAGSTLCHIGPIGISSYDLAIFLEAAAGADACDLASSAGRPLGKGELVEALGRGVRDLRIGIDDSLWSGLESSFEKPLRDALSALEREGARLVPVQLPLAAHAAPIGYLTFAIEFYAALRSVREQHLNELGMDTQIVLGVVEGFRADDYVDAQRLRAGLRLELATVLREVDVLALPTTAGTAPSAGSSDEFLDPQALDQACRYAFLGNLTGLPAATAPVGYASDGLPVGLQIIGDAWDEAAVLQVLTHLERIDVAIPARPEARVDLLA
jgi:aspartyl-tRNA(Asn)/glutamyl-tRNA(Gln) amidotransferase subunit A